MSKDKKMVTFISNDGSPLRHYKPERNMPCPCGSGKKAKKCCGTETTYFLTGDALQKRIEEQEKRKAEEKQKTLGELIHD